MIPGRLVTDKGRNLDNSTIRNFAACLGFPITHIPAGIHQVNVSESLNKIINAGIRGYTNKDLSNWDNILPILSCGD